jgi:hypothetical protein
MPWLNWLAPVEADEWWGRKGDQFQIEMTITGSRHQKALGILQNDAYQEVIDFGTYPGSPIQFHENVSFTVESDSGFMWVDTIGTCGWGAKIYSNADYNFGELDLFSAYSLTDSPLMKFRDKHYGEASTDAWDDLYLLAFNGMGHSWGKGFDLLAVVSRTAGDGSPVATPVPAAVILLASGCSGLAVWRRISGDGVPRSAAGNKEKASV